MTDGTVNLIDIFIGNVGPAKVFQRRTSLYQFLNQVTSFSDTYNNILMVAVLSAAVTLRHCGIILYMACGLTRQSS